MVDKWQVCDIGVQVGVNIVVDKVKLNKILRNFQTKSFKILY